MRRALIWLFVVAFMALYGVCALACFVLVLSSVYMDEPLAALVFFVLAVSCACVARWVGLADGE